MGKGYIIFFLFGTNRIVRRPSEAAKPVSTTPPIFKGSQLIKDAMGRFFFERYRVNCVHDWGA
jgi:hypothetical protein